MIRISQLKLPVSHSREDLEMKIEKTLGVSLARTESWRIVRRSVDARKKDQLLYIYSIDVLASWQIIKREQRWFFPTNLLR